MQEMRIVVTGGAGFIASHVADAYVADGHRVTIIDNLSGGKRKNVPRKAHFYNADIRSLQALRTIFKKEKPDAVNHHAALIDVVGSVKDPKPTFETNVTGTLNLLAAFSAYGKKKKRFIFASTGGAIYGNPNPVKADEKAPPLPLAPYGLSKLLGEEIIHYYARLERISYLILRYANVYGERQEPHGEAGVVPIFAGLIRKNKRPTIFGDGSKTRDYVYVGDVARANILGLTRGTNETVNIGRGEEITDQEIYEAIARTLRFKKHPIYEPFRKGEVYRIALDARRAKRVLGWNARVALKEGIRKTLAYDS